MLGSARAQVWSYSPSYRRPRHFHAEPELNLIVRGRATFGIGRAVIEARAGELLGFPPGHDHVLLRGSPDLEFFAIGMRAAMSRAVLRGRERTALRAPLRVRLAPPDFAALLARTTAVAHREGVDGQIAELWEMAQSLRFGKERLGGDKPPHTLAQRALELLNDEPELPRYELARKSAACPSEISRYFHRDFGITLVQYRTRLRLLRFIQRVDEGASLASAAFEAGFGSYSQCHRAFSATLGCTPRAFFAAGLRDRMENRFVS